MPGSMSPAARWRRAHITVLAVVEVGWVAERNNPRQLGGGCGAEGCVDRCDTTRAEVEDGAEFVGEGLYELPQRIGGERIGVGQ
jgi:hypothetical protein